MLKSFTDHYRVAGQTSFDLTALKKNKKIRKIQKKLSECKNTIRFDFCGSDLPIRFEKSKISDKKNNIKKIEKMIES